MKRISSVALLSVFLYILVGHYFVLSILEMRNRLQMEFLLEENQSLKTLRISKANFDQLTFLNGEKEARYNGKIYDIKEKRIEGESLVLTCIQDDREGELLSELDKNVCNNIDGKSSGAKKQSPSPKITLNDFCFNMNRGGLPRPFEKATHQMHAAHFSWYIVSISSPPPEV